jgi:hypothetical protein
MKIVEFNEEDRVVNEFNLSECVICMETFTKGENVRQIPSCRHIFHPDCIMMWLKAQQSYEIQKCPVCNAEI